MLQASVSSQASTFDLTLWNNRHLDPSIYTSEQEIREREVQKPEIRLFVLKKGKKSCCFFLSACFCSSFCCTFSFSYKHRSQGQASSSYQKDVIKWNWTAVYDIALLFPLNSLRFQDWSLTKCSKVNSLYLINSLPDLDCYEAVFRCPWGGWLLTLSFIHCLAVLLQ